MDREALAHLLFDVDEQIKRGTKFGPWVSAQGHIKRRYLKRAELILHAATVTARDSHDVPRL